MPPVIPKHVTASEILEKVSHHIAPLPSQAGYVKDLASILAGHINRNFLIDAGYKADSIPQFSALVLGGTGQGKTYILKKMVECLDLSFLTVDCSTLVGESYKGVSLSQRLAGAMDEAKNRHSSERLIVFFDECDKLCQSGSAQSSGMTAILQMFNGGTVAVGKDDRSSQSIDVSRFTILLGGAFVGLDSIVRERVYPKTRIGFDSTPRQTHTDAELMQMVTMADLARYGLMWELLGRIGELVVVPPLTLEDYEQLLIAPNASVRKKYDTYLSALYNVRFDISKQAVQALAEQCMCSLTGARAVNPLVNRLMRKAIADVEKDASIRKVILDAEDGNCCVRYEHGDVEQADAVVKRNEQYDETKWHIIKAKSTDDLVKKLCRYCRNLFSGYEMQSQLEVFLKCAVPYLFFGYEKDFTMEALLKLAKVTQRVGSSSTFENMIRRSFRVSADDYAKFSGAYNEWFSRNIVSALEGITEYLAGKHGTHQIRFRILKRKNS